MRERARALVFKYVADHQDDLDAPGRPSARSSSTSTGVVVSGRADVIYDEHDGVPDNLAIVDYKTSTGGAIEPLQLQVYADAGRREGLTVGAAFVHDMGTTTRHDVDVGADATSRQAETQVIATAESLKAARLHSHARESRSAVRATCRRCAAPRSSSERHDAAGVLQLRPELAGARRGPRPTMSGRPGACSALGT